MSTLKYLWLLAISTILIFSSCDEDSFSQVATIELPEHEPLPVVNLQIEAGQERDLMVLVSNSKGLLDPQSTYDIPEDAEVNLFRNGSLYAPFVYIGQSQKYEAFLDNPFPSQQGDVYRLEATIPGFNTVNVEQTMPVKPFIETATFEEDGTIDEGGFRVNELIIDIVDQEPGATNYYGLDAYYFDLEVDPATGDTLSYSRTRAYIDTADPLLNYGSRYSLIFNDQGFSGDKYQARCYTYSNPNDASEIHVYLYQLSEDAFLYSRSLEQYYNALDNPFAEPVTVHSNVPNGYGIFTVVNRTIFPIEL